MEIPKLNTNFTLAESNPRENTLDQKASEAQNTSQDTNRKLTRRSSVETPISPSMALNQN